MGSITQGFDRFNKILIDKVKDDIKDRKDKDSIDRANTETFFFFKKKIVINELDTISMGNSSQVQSKFMSNQQVNICPSETFWESSKVKDKQ